MKPLSLLSKFTLASLFLTTAIAVTLAWGIQQHLEQNALQREAENAADQVAAILHPNLRLADFTGPLAPTRYAEIDTLIRHSILSSHIVRVKIWNREGLLLYADEPDLAGRRFAIDPDLQAALDGQIVSDVSSLQKEENVGERGRFDRVLEIYIPVRPLDSSQIAGAYEIYHDLAAVEPHIAELGRFVWSSVALGFLILYGSLFTLVRNASRELVQRSQENARLAQDLILTYDTTLEGWVRALDLRDQETEGHSQRVTERTLRLARALGRNEAELVHIRRGALLHDIGKMAISDAILLKPGPLSDEEWTIMRQHPVYAYELLSPIPYLRPALDIPYGHHEKWDGTGYPRGLKGEQIPLAARIFAVVDVWDALRSDRPYRSAWPEERVREHIRSLAGAHFDPQVVQSFLALH